MNQPTIVKSVTRLTLLAVVVSSALLFVYYLIFALVLPLATTDNLQKYTGIQRKVAEKSIAYSARYLDDKTRFAYHYQVNDVRLTSAQDFEKFCTPLRGEIASDNEDIRAYTVTMTVREIFNPFSRVVIIDGCTAFGSHADGPYISR